MKGTVDRVFRVLSALSSLSLAATYLLTWAGLRTFDASTSVRHLGYVVVAEFVQLTLSLPLVIFLVGPLAEEFRLKSSRGVFFAVMGMLALALVITGACLSASAGAAWPMVGVILLLLGKWNLYTRPPREKLESRRMMADAVLRITVLFFLLLACVLIPFPAWKAPASMEEFGDMRPAGLLVLGACYFGFFGLFGHRLEALVSAEDGDASPPGGPPPSEGERMVPGGGVEPP